MPRKYVTEIGLNMCLTQLAMAQQDQLANLPKNYPAGMPDFHLYAITRRPRVTIVPGTLVLTKEFLEVTVAIHLQGSKKTVPLRIPSRLKGESLIAISPYPHTEYQVLDVKGVRVSGGNISLLLQGLLIEKPDTFDLEVLYIGQAYGKNGERIASDRLMSHSTLQGIYFDALSKYPDYDIWIVPMEFEQLHIMSFDGTTKSTTTLIEDDAHRDKVLKTGITRDQQINYAEAALIKYFQPVYNVMFRDQFPSQTHTSYSQCYDLEINSVMFEMDTEPIRVRLFSEKAPRKWVHMKDFPLYLPADRHAMFDFTSTPRSKP